MKRELLTHFQTLGCSDIGWMLDGGLEVDGSSEMTEREEELASLWRAFFCFRLDSFGPCTVRSLKPPSCATLLALEFVDGPASDARGSFVMVGEGAHVGDGEGLLGSKRFSGSRSKYWRNISMSSLMRASRSSDSEFLLLSVQGEMQLAQLLQAHSNLPLYLSAISYQCPRPIYGAHTFWCMNWCHA